MSSAGCVTHSPKFMWTDYKRECVRKRERVHVSCVCRECSRRRRRRRQTRRRSSGSRREISCQSTALLCSSCCCVRSSVPQRCDGFTFTAELERRYYICMRLLLLYIRRRRLDGGPIAHHSFPLFSIFECRCISFSKRVGITRCHTI